MLFGLFLSLFVYFVFVSYFFFDVSQMYDIILVVFDRQIVSKQNECMTDQVLTFNNE